MADRTTPPRSVITAFSLLLLIVAGWSIYWFSFRAKLQDDIANFRTALADAGMKLDCTDESWGGFPFRYELACQNPSLHGEYEGRPTALRASQLRLYMQAYNPFHIMALADGPTLLNGNRLAHATARASLRYDTTGNWDAAAELPKAELAGAATADMLKLFARVIDDKLQFAFDAQNLAPLMAPLPALSAGLTAETDAGILSTPDPLAFATANETPLSITKLTLNAGDVSIDGTGQLRLDGTGRLNGKLNSSVSNPSQLLDLLATPLGLSPDEVGGGQAVVGLLGGTKPGKPVKLKITAEAGGIYIGPLKIADIPPVR